MWLRSCIRYTVSRVVPPYRVHEIMDIPMAPEWIEGRQRFNGRFYHELDYRSKKRTQGGGGRGGRGRQQQQQQTRQEPKRSWGAKGSGLAGDDQVSWITRAPLMNLEASTQFGELPGGRDIYPLYDHPQCVDGAPIWEVEREGDDRVYAAPMSHTVSCFGCIFILVACFLLLLT